MVVSVIKKIDKWIDLDTRVRVNMKYPSYLSPPPQVLWLTDQEYSEFTNNLQYKDYLAFTPMGIYYKDYLICTYKKRGKI